MCKNIFINQTDNRFTNAIINSKSNNSVIHSLVSNNIYDIFYRFNIDVFVFNVSTLDSSIIQFMQEFSKEKNIYLYINSAQFDNAVLNIPNIKYIQLKLLDIKLPEEPIIFDSNVINTNIFYRDDSKKKQKGTIACFLDRVAAIPDSLEKHLYPNSTKAIRLYNNSNINHYQNLGVLSEKDKNTILNESESFIIIDENYLFEAVQTGCQLLTPELTEYVLPKNLQITTIEHFLEQHIL